MLLPLNNFMGRTLSLLMPPSCRGLLIRAILTQRCRGFQDGNALGLLAALQVLWAGVL